MAENTIEIEGKIVKFKEVPDVLGEYGCKACLGDRCATVCIDLPINCGSARVHFVEVK